MDAFGKARHLVISITHHQQQIMKSSQTPLRRVSSGALKHSHNSSLNQRDIVQHPLEFLTPALSDLSDELDGIMSSTHQMVELDKALADFNHGFGSLLWALKLNAYCINWPEVGCELLGKHSLIGIL